MTARFRGVTLVGNTINQIKESHGIGEEDYIYLDNLIDEYDMEVLSGGDTKEHIIGYRLPLTLELSLSSVNNITKIAKKFYKATGVDAKISSCLEYY